MKILVLKDLIGCIHLVNPAKIIFVDQDGDFTRWWLDHPTVQVVKAFGTLEEAKNTWDKALNS